MNQSASFFRIIIWYMLPLVLLLINLAGASQLWNRPLDQGVGMQRRAKNIKQMLLGKVQAQWELANDNLGGYHPKRVVMEEIVKMLDNNEFNCLLEIIELLAIDLKSSDVKKHNYAACIFNGIVDACKSRQESIKNPSAFSEVVKSLNNVINKNNTGKNLSTSKPKNKSISTDEFLNDLFNGKGK